MESYEIKKLRYDHYNQQVHSEIYLKKKKNSFFKGLLRKINARRKEITSFLIILLKTRIKNRKNEGNPNQPTRNREKIK